MPTIGSGLGSQFGLVAETYQNDVQTISVTGTPTGGTFTLVTAYGTTGTIAFNATATAVQTTLNALPGLGGSTTTGVTCTGGPFPGSNIIVTFSGTLVTNRAQTLFTLGTNSLTGGSSPTASVAHTTTGSGYGAGGTVTRFLEIENESLSNQIQQVESSALRANNRFLRTDRWALNRKGAGGDVNFEVMNTGFGLLFKQLMGASSITTPSGASLTRLHTYTCADMTGQSHYVQIGRPDTNQEANPFNYIGGKITAAEFTNDVDGLLLLKATYDFQDEQQTTTLAAASYPSSQQPFNWIQGTVQIQGATVGYVNKVSVQIENTLNAGRYFLRGGYVKSEPIPNGYAKISGTLSMEFNDTTAYNRFVTGTTASVVLTWTGAQIEATTPPYSYQVVMTIPNARFDGTTPNVAGPDVLGFDMPFTGLYDGTNSPLTIQYYTTDTAD